MPPVLSAFEFPRKKRSRKKCGTSTWCARNMPECDFNSAKETSHNKKIEGKEMPGTQSVVGFLGRCSCILDGS